MIVKELIAMLQALPNQDQRIVLQGYEGGYGDINGIDTVQLTLNVNSEWYYGKHESADTNADADCTAYYLPR